MIYPLSVYRQIYLGHMYVHNVLWVKQWHGICDIASDWLTYFKEQHSILEIVLGWLTWFKQWCAVRLPWAG
jgi:hypothetical protein